jgi:hypothetical protein
MSDSLHCPLLVLDFELVSPPLPEKVCDLCVWDHNLSHHLSSAYPRQEASSQGKLLREQRCHYLYVAERPGITICSEEVPGLQPALVIIKLPGPSTSFPSPRCLQGRGMEWL